jgi:hypothetical protein
MGFNAGDWIVRSSQFISDGSGMPFESESLYTYAQRTFTDYGVMVQGARLTSLTAASVSRAFTGSDDAG